ncbi:hypothetical protein GCM10028786_08060 [Flaviaesturariibacter terrae]
MLSFGLLLSACRKTDLAAPAEAEAADSTSFPATPPPAHPERGLVSSIHTANVVITDWESAGTWSRQPGEANTVKYGISRSFHEMTQDMLDNGSVLVFVKGYNFADSSTEMRAMGMPFYFYLPIERMNFPVYWEYLKKIGGVDISLKLLSDANAFYLAGRDRVRLRYFLLTQAELARRGLTPEALHNMTYQEISTMYGLTP